MRDARLDKLAQVLVRYSTRVQPGELVLLQGDPVALPLLEAIYDELLRAGAHVRLNCQPGHFQEAFYALANDAQLQYVSPLALHEMQTVTARIALWAETNTRALSNVDPRRQRLASAARQPIMKVFLDRAARGELKWVGTLFPTAASAQDAEMGLREYEDFVFRAGYLHLADPVAEWRRLHACQQRLTDYLNGKQTVRFQTPQGTDLTVTVGGMKWINCCGTENFPDGEVFTGPDLAAADGGVNGVVRFSFPAVHHGHEADGVELTFERGRVVRATARKGEEFLRAMLAQDDGASRLGEIAIGTNYQVQRFTRNTLFDEKIGGTFHAAVGSGYPETGNSNESGLHWDMVCDLRQGGTITVDGVVIAENGRFRDPTFPAPAA